MALLRTGRSLGVEGFGTCNEGLCAGQSLPALPLANQLARTLVEYEIDSDVRISNVHVTDADSRYACLIAGVEGRPVSNVRIRNLYVQFRGGLTLKDVEEQRGSNPFFRPEARKPGQLGEANYPEPSAHGIQPAWGFSISHARNIRLKNVRLETIQPDERPMLHLENIRNVRISLSE